MHRKQSVCIPRAHSLQPTDHRQGSLSELKEYTSNTKAYIRKQLTALFQLPFFVFSSSYCPPYTVRINMAWYIDIWAESCRRTTEKTKQKKSKPTSYIGQGKKGRHTYDSSIRTSIRRFLCWRHCFALLLFVVLVFLFSMQLTFGTYERRGASPTPFFFMSAWSCLLASWQRGPTTPLPRSLRRYTSYKYKRISQPYIGLTHWLAPPVLHFVAGPNN